MRYINQKFSGGRPLKVGDRYYGFDHVRDWWYQMEKIGRGALDGGGFTPDSVISGGVVTQGSTATRINISETVAYCRWSVELPNTAAVPPTTAFDNSLMRVVLPAQTDFELTGATLNGSAVNYVKLKYAETDVWTRQRALAAGTYVFAVEGDFVLACDTVAPVSGEAVLAQVRGDGSTWLDATRPNESGVVSGYKNIIINGSMDVAQRGDVVETENNKFPVDRWALGLVGGAPSSLAAQRGGSLPIDGFPKALFLTVNAVHSPLAVNDYLYIVQPIEGLNFKHLLWGTSEAKPVTVSFWVRSSVVGTYSVGFRSKVTDASYFAPYAVSAANTWERKIITIPGATFGGFGVDNTLGAALIFSFGVGSDFAATPNTWIAGNMVGSTQDTNLRATIGAVAAITGVQVEEGSRFTGFEHRAFDLELGLCQRYVHVFTALSNARIACGGWASSTGGSAWLPLGVGMRTNPTLGSWSAVEVVLDGVSWYAVSALTASGDSVMATTLLFSVLSSSAAVGQVAMIGSSSPTTVASITLDAEI